MRTLALQTTPAPVARTVIRALSILGFTLATAAAAHIRVPVPGTVVPLTLQTALVLAAGLRLGRRDAALSQALYVAGGAAGLPFFAGASGIHALFGPTGGYLLGFVAAAWVCGWLAGALDARAGGSFWRAWVAAFLASLVLFIPGMIQLKLALGLNMDQALMMGLVPFLLADLAKVTLAAAAHSAVRSYFL